MGLQSPEFLPCDLAYPAVTVKSRLVNQKPKLVVVSRVQKNPGF